MLQCKYEKSGFLFWRTNINVEGYKFKILEQKSKYYGTMPYINNIYINIIY